MEIATAWANYVRRMSAIDSAATERVGAFIGSYPNFSFSNADNMNDLIQYAYGISAKYGEAAAALACEMYDAVGLASGLLLDPAEPADVATYSDVAKAINGTAKTGNSKTVASSIGRLVKMAGAETTLQNAQRDGAEFAWIPSGDTCAYCLTLASRGWQSSTEGYVKNGHPEHIHGNCDCAFGVRFNEKTSYKGYNPDKYLKMYYDAPLEEGETPSAKNRVNALRRQIYAQNKEKINAQKRTAYEKQKERESSMAEEYNVN